MNTLSKAERIVMRRKMILFLVIAFAFLAGFIFFSSLSKAESSRPIYTYYTSYQIQDDDTLWSIADKYMTVENSDKSAFIKNIKSMNHMLDDNIKAGDYLIIEYQSYDKL